MLKKCGLRRGDTIIEVMLAMSVIGLVIGAAFGIANRSIAVGQDAQERTEALKIAETQLEILKTEFADSADVRRRTEQDPFCFDMRTRAVMNASDCTQVSPNGGEGLYTIVITPPGLVDSTGSYTIEVTWTQLGSATVDAEPNIVTLYYVIGSI